jgi:peptide/nickel transport system permease protein
VGLREYVLKRIVYSFVLIIFVITLNFIIFEMMPGNPAEYFVNPIRLGQRERIAALEKQWGLTDPLYVRYARYVVNLFTWQFGDSFTTGSPVLPEMVMRIPYTLVLLGGSAAIAMVIGILLGILAAHKRGGKFDTTAVTVSLTTYSLPTFWIGMLLLLIFYSTLQWFPGAGAYPREWVLPGRWPAPTAVFNVFGTTITIPGWADIAARLQYATLPLLTLILFHYGGWLLLTRATMIETLTEDYVTTARAKGLKERTVLMKHALKNASLPLITSAALTFGFILSGAIITESVFTWPGLGGWIWQAIQIKDYPVLQAIFYVIGLCVIVANFIADLLYGVIDPRIKYG